ncbi:MAG: hypothetical protein LBK70_02040 [Clostridiales bacterium]|jgi:hypothetical protein|nr:hypothetical protein [Clostridiales bacterium]
MKRVINYDSTARFSGEVVNGKRHGYGVLQYANGNRYEGNFAFGEFFGRGVFTYSNGDRYEGEFAYSKHHGKGLLFFANGDKYEGDFAFGKIHGVGIFHYANGDRYEGDFAHGKYHGTGAFYCFNGNRYEGYFEYGKFHGRGTYYFVNVDKFEGEFIEGKLHGAGLYSYSDGTTERREYKHNEWLNKPSHPYRAQHDLLIEGSNKIDSTALLTNRQISDGASAAIGNTITRYESKLDNQIQTLGSPANFEGAAIAPANQIDYGNLHQHSQHNGCDCGYDAHHSSHHANHGYHTPKSTTVEQKAQSLPTSSNGVDKAKSGVYYFANGDRFESEFTDADNYSKGVYYYANGDRFEGR